MQSLQVSIAVNESFWTLIPVHSCVPLCVNYYHDQLDGFFPSIFQTKKQTTKDQNKWQKGKESSWLGWIDILAWKHCYLEFICDFFVLSLLVQGKNIFNFLLVFFVKMAVCCSNVDFSLQCIGSSSTLFGFSALDKLLFSVLVQHEHQQPIVIIIVITVTLMITNSLSSPSQLWSSLSPWSLWGIRSGEESQLCCFFRMLFRWPERKRGWW